MESAQCSLPLLSLWQILYDTINYTILIQARTILPKNVKGLALKFCAVSPSDHLFKDGKGTKNSTKSKGVAEFSPELCSKTWVPIMDHIVRQAKLYDNTLEKQMCNLFSAQLPPPKYMQSKQCTLSYDQNR